MIHPNEAIYAGAGVPLSTASAGYLVMPQRGGANDFGHYLQFYHDEPGVRKLLSIGGGMAIEVTAANQLLIHTATLTYTPTGLPALSQAIHSVFPYISGGTTFALNVDGLPWACTSASGGLAGAAALSCYIGYDPNASAAAAGFTPFVYAYLTAPLSGRLLHMLHNGGKGSDLPRLGVLPTYFYFDQRNLGIKLRFCQATRGVLNSAVYGYYTRIGYDISYSDTSRMFFDGTNDYVTVAGTIQGTTDPTFTEYTIGCMWTRQSDTGAIGANVAADLVAHAGLELYLNSTGQTSLYYPNGSALNITNSASVTTSANNFSCASFKVGASTKLYSNATLSTHAAITAGFKPTSSAYVGNNAGNSFRHFGFIWYLWRFKRQLTDTEVGIIRSSSVGEDGTLKPAGAIPTPAQNSTFNTSDPDLLNYLEGGKPSPDDNIIPAVRGGVATFFGLPTNTPDLDTLFRRRLGLQLP